MSISEPNKYELVADALRDGDVVPFLGAAVNFAQRPPAPLPPPPAPPPPSPPADAPSPQDPSHPQSRVRSDWDVRQGFLPSGKELALWLARKSNMRSRETHYCEDLSLVSSYMEVKGGRAPLEKYLWNAIGDPRSVGATTEVHALLASMPKPMLIITTNYDTLIEQAFNAAGVPYDLVTHPSIQGDCAASVIVQSVDFPPGDPSPSRPAPARPCPANQLDLDPSRKTVIYKMHGSVGAEHDQGCGYIITEDDYVRFLVTMPSETVVPPVLFDHLKSRHLLFLGYGMRDWNLRILLGRLRVAASSPSRGAPPRAASNGFAPVSRTHWAVQRNPHDFEAELWKARGVELYCDDILAFTRELARNFPSATPARGQP